MAYTYTTVKSLFTAICDAIRSKDGTAEEIDHQDIPDRIGKIPTAPKICDYTEFFLRGRRINEMEDLLACSYQVSSAASMYASCNTPSVDVDLTDFDWYGDSSSHDLRYMFSSCVLNSVVFGPVNFGYVMITGGMFQGANIKTDVDLSLVGLTYGSINLNQTMLRCKAKRIAFFGYINNVSYDNECFSTCTNLEELILPDTHAVLPATNQNTFASLPETCVIYVPRDLLDGYKAATNWSQIASQFAAIEDYPGTPWWKSAQA